MSRLKIKRIIQTLISTGLLFFTSCTVVKHDEQNQKDSGEVEFYFESDNFDASAYVEENWESKIFPEIKYNAHGLSVVVEDLKTNREKAIKDYGIKKTGSSFYSFMVKGSDIIKKLDRSSSAGLMVLENGAKIQIGPVIKKSVVRDSLSFINFGDFSNQIEYANISREINIYIKKNIVNSVSSDFTVGDNIEIIGVFILDKSDNIIITPIFIEKTVGEE